jgi:hypothetical protein
MTQLNKNNGVRFPTVDLDLSDRFIPGLMMYPPQHLTCGKFSSRSLVAGFRRILADRLPRITLN